MSRLVLATANPGKVAELRALLPSEIELVTAPSLGIEMPEETGTTFEENAILKAEAVWQATGLPTLADDSGLEVDALDGQPGVYSARFAGPENDHEANIQLLLAKLSGVPASARTARFRAVIIFIDEKGEQTIGHGSVEGTIGEGQRGSGGFGYDPVFVTGTGATMAEISAEEKNQISHRSLAIRQILPYILGSPVEGTGE